MKIEAIFFDMDGTIFDTENFVIKITKEVLSDCGLFLPDVAFKECIGKNYESCKNICLKYGGDDYPFEDIWEKSAKILSANKFLPIKEGAVELLDYLYDNKIDCFIVTSSKTSVAENYLQGSKLKKYFKYIIGGETCKQGKPFPDIYNEAIRTAKISPEKILVIEDSFAGVESAYKANLKVIMIPDLLEPTEEVLKMVYKKENNLSKVINIVKELNNGY